LKHCMVAMERSSTGSPPHGGVWIETIPVPVNNRTIASPPHGGVWIETPHEEHVK